MMEKNSLQEIEQLSKEDRAYLEEYQGYMSELAQDCQEADAALFERAMQKDEEAQVSLAELYMKKALEAALKRVNQGVALNRLIEYGMVGAILGIEKISNVAAAHEEIMSEMEQYIQRCFPQ